MINFLKVSVGAELDQNSVCRHIQIQRVALGYVIVASREKKVIWYFRRIKSLVHVQGLLAELHVF